VNGFSRFTFDDPLAKIAQRFTELENQIRAVAGGPRVGLADIQSDTVGAPFPLTTAGIGITNWEDDAAGGGTPVLTMTTGSRAIIMWACRASYVGELGTSIGQTDFRSSSVAMGVQIDDVEPQLWPAPAMAMNWANSLVDVLMFQPLAYFVVRKN
jgi:hypothetical protein